MPVLVNGLLAALTLGALVCACFAPGASIGGVLVGHFVIGVASAAYLPGIFGYVSTAKQSEAGAAAGMVQVRKTHRCVVLRFFFLFLWPGSD